MKHYLTLLLLLAAGSVAFAQTQTPVKQSALPRQAFGSTDILVGFRNTTGYPATAYDAAGLVSYLNGTLSLDWARITSGKPTTAAGYGLTDVLTLSAAASTYLSQANAASTYLTQANAASTYAPLSHTQALSTITQSGATNGQVPKWNGSAWAPADDATGAVAFDVDALAAGTNTDLGSTDNIVVSDNGTEKKYTLAEWLTWLQSQNLTFANLTATNLSFTTWGSGTVPDANIASTLARDSEVAAAYQPLDADLTSWAGVTRASGFDTFTATPSSANLAAALTNETGTGSAVFGTNPTLAAPTYTVAAVSAAAIDWAAGDTHTKTLSANTTFTFSNNASGKQIVVAVTNTASNYTVTWPTVSWSGGTAPTQTTGAKTDIYTFIQIGSTIYGSVVQNF